MPLLQTKDVCGLVASRRRKHPVLAMQLLPLQPIWPIAEGKAMTAFIRRLLHGLTFRAEDVWFHPED